MLDRWYGASLDALEISFSKSPENFPLSSLADNSAQGTTRANAFTSLLENLDCFSFLMFLLKDHTVVCLFVTMPKWPKTQESGYWRRPNNQANWKGTLLRQGNDRFWIQRKRSAICKLLLLLSDTDTLKETRSNVKTAMTICVASNSHRELEWNKTERQVKCSSNQKTVTDSKQLEQCPRHKDEN